MIRSLTFAVDVGSPRNTDIPTSTAAVAAAPAYMLGSCV